MVVGVVCEAFSSCAPVSARSAIAPHNMSTDRMLTVEMVIGDMSCGEKKM